MKQGLIIATALVLLSGSGFFFAQQIPSETPVSKNINVEVYKTASYGSPAYANATAALEVTIVRVTGNKRDTAWQHTFQPRELKDFPDSNQPITQKISIPNVNDNKERLEIYYKLTYDSKGSVLNFWNTTRIDKGQQQTGLEIQI